MEALDRREFLRGLGSIGALALISQVGLTCSPASKKMTVNISPATNVVIGTTTQPEPTTSTLATTNNTNHNPSSPVTATSPDIATHSPTTKTTIAATPGDIIALPEPSTKGSFSVEEALARRRSIRTYSGKALTLQEVSQLLWAAQGVTSYNGYRTAPSAMASYLLRTYLITINVANLATGIYRYQSSGHSLGVLRAGDFSADLTLANIGGYFVPGGAAYIVFTADPSRTRFGTEATKFLSMEAGHAAQNVYLQATALGLGTVVNGGFSADRTREILGISAGEEPLYWMPVGRQT